MRGESELWNLSRIIAAVEAIVKVLKTARVLIEEMTLT
jgi:hypothetical protein